MDISDVTPSEIQQFAPLKSDHRIPNRKPDRCSNHHDFSGAKGLNLGVCNTVDGFRNPGVDMVNGKYPFIYRVSSMLGGCLGFLNHQQP